MPIQAFRPWSRFAFLPVALLLVLPAARAADSLDAGFQAPPDSAKPQTWWHWMNGNVTKEGITADLEAMKQIGLGGAEIFNADCGIPAGRVKFNSPEWHDMFVHAVHEAGRLGLQLEAHNCAGWSSSGGPWNVVSNAMMRVVTSEISVTGPTNFSATLPEPPAKLDYYRDIAVLAFHTPTGENGTPVHAKVTASVADVDGAPLLDSGNNVQVTLPLPTADHPQFFQLEFPEPFTVRSLQLIPGAGTSNARGVIQASSDGVTFRQCGEFALPHRPTRAMIFSLGDDAVTAKFYRVVFNSLGNDAKEISLRGIQFSPRLRTENFEAKDGDTGGFVDSMSSDNRPSGDVAVRRDATIDLTANVDGSGRLNWKVPAGDWAIVRVGFTPTGRDNHPAPAEGTGLECDKFSPAALDAHWAGFMQKLVEDAGPLVGKAFVGGVIDSYEVGGQNWSANFRNEFKQRRGYDPTPFLAAFTGRVVESPDITERFLWDMRRTIADLFADNYYRHFTQLCHSNGLIASIEPYTGPFESLQCGEPADIVMGEFWSGSQGHPSVKLAASVAHIYGKQIVGAESFTAAPSAQHGRWLEDPYSLKALGDLEYCTGLNRFIFHRYAMQPWTNRWPGMTMGQWGFHFERTETWWKQGKAWIDYVSRSQFLLQQGRYVADAAYFNGENAPSEMREGHPPLPAGYQFDAINADVLLHHASVKKGRLNLDGGASYAVLILPPEDLNLTPPVLKRINGFVHDGLTVVGAPPQHSPSLEDFPKCDAEVKALAKKLWGLCDGKKIQENQFGKGRVAWGKPLAEVFSELNLGPDFKYQSADADSKVIYCHRQLADTEIYFVSNQRQLFDAVDCSFRVTGKAPELWNPETGSIQPAPVWRVESGRTIVPVQFGPSDSMFVVFRDKPQGDHFVSAESQNAKPSDWQFVNGKQIRAFAAGDFELRTALGKNTKLGVENVPPALEIAGDWQLSFPPNWGAPDSVVLDKLISWTEHTNSGVRYFSGTATYEKRLEIPADDLASEREVWLDLGAVKNFAEISLNGESFGVLWKPPYCVNVTAAAHAGANSLKIKVTNLWPNRLIGDEQLPDDRAWKGKQLAAWPQWLLDGKPSPTGRLTFTTWHHWTKDDALVPSGLLGPVTLKVAEIKPLHAE